MQRIIMWAFMAIIAVLALPFIVQGVRFESHHSEMTGLIETADPADRNLPQSVRDLLLFSLGGHTTPYSARLLIREFDAGVSNNDVASWNVTYSTWCLLVAMHFSERDRLTLIARLAPTGVERYGLHATSQTLFGRPLSELSLADAGTLIVLTREPSLYDKPKRLAAERNQFLSLYQKGTYFSSTGQ